MNTAVLRSERILAEKSTKELAKVIDKSEDAYRKKERGDVQFTLGESARIAIALGLSFDKFNVIFYDGRLPYGNPT